jgi:hypothetical protein
MKPALLLNVQLCKIWLSTAAHSYTQVSSAYSACLATASCPWLVPTCFSLLPASSNQHLRQLTILDTSYMQYLSFCTQLIPLSITVLSVHPCCRFFLLILRLNSISFCVHIYIYIYIYIYAYIHKHICCFCTWAMKANGTINVEVLMFLWDPNFNSFGNNTQKGID